MNGVGDALDRSAEQPVASNAALAAPGQRLASRSARPDSLAPALVAALALHGALLGVLLLAVQPARLPEIAGAPAVLVVFEPNTPSQPAPSDEQAITPPPASPVPAEAVQPPDTPTPPTLAQAEPIPDIQALAPPTPDAVPAPETPARPPQLEPPRSARSYLRPIPPLPAAPKHLQQESARLRAPPSVATTPSQARLKIAPQQQQPSTQVASASGPNMGAWRDALMAWLEKHKTYPEAAREQGTEGRVLVRFTISRDGRVLDASLARSSGSRELDMAALSLVRGARLPPFPASVTQETLTATLPLTYQLE